MKVVVTGGGTGGHVFPALEIAKEFSKRGDDVVYLGSLRGQEGRACLQAHIAFQGFPSEPLYRLTSWKGLRGAVNLARATVMARRTLQSQKPDAVFSTGGYASAPVVHAAAKLGIPYVIHEQNTVPGRTNRMLGRQAACVATTFRTGAEHFEGARVVRTGMPLREEFRHGGQGNLGFAQTLNGNDPILLVVGGSQGAQAINEAAVATAVRMVHRRVTWLHVAGPKHYEGMLGTLNKLAVHDRYELRAFLDGNDMAGAIFACDLAICRSGAGTLAELAAMRKPAILIPYPSAFADHQRANAREFVEMGAADLLEESDLQPASLEARIFSWMDETDRLQAAREALAQWHCPDAIERIVELVQHAAGRVAFTA